MGALVWTQGRGHLRENRKYLFRRVFSGMLGSQTHLLLTYTRGRARDTKRI